MPEKGVHTRFGTLLTRSCLVMVSGFAATAAGAQAIPRPIAPTREEIQRPTPQRPELPSTRLEVEGGIERAPCALDRPEYADIRFTPNEVTFEDLKGLSAEALRPAYAQYIGTEQPVSVICEIRDRAATILRDAGYIAAVAVPEQRIADGKVNFQVLMAKLVGLRVRGDAGGAEKMITEYLQPLTHEEVFNRFQAERSLLLAGELPGYTVRLALRSAGQARGELIGEVTVLRTPVTLEANVQNFGSEDLGRFGGMVRAQFFGLTGLGDRTLVSAFSTLDFNEQQTLQIAHDFRLGGSGLGIGGQFTYAWAEPDLSGLGDPGDPEIHLESVTKYATLEMGYPLIRTSETTLRGSVGFDLIDQDVDFNEIPLSKDHLRVLFARMNADLTDTNYQNGRYSFSEPHWRLFGSVELRQGLDIFGASENCSDDPQACLDSGKTPPSRLDGDSTATVLRGAIQGEFRPMRHFTLMAGMRGQATGSPLLSFEEFAGGNYTVGRGYDPGAILGDRGLGFQAEMRVGSTIPATTTSLAVEPFVFIDQAIAWNEDVFGGKIPRQELTSVGGGIRASLGGQFLLDATFAAPLDRVFGVKPDPRLLISFTTHLLPWTM